MRQPSRPGRLLFRRRGATGTEYGLILGLVGVAILTAVAATGAALAGLFGSAADSLKGRGIVLEPAHIAENSPAGTVIGTLSGENLGEGLSFSIADDSGDFTVSGDSLLAARSFDFEAEPGLTVQIRASGGNTEPGGFVAPVSVGVDNVPDTAPALSLSTASLDFQWVDGPSGSPTPAQSVTVSNGGDLPGTLAITLDDAGGHFERSGGDCGGSLAGHSSCTVALRALAAENGDWTGSLGLGDAGTVTLTASATGWASEPVLTPGTMTAAIADGISPGPASFVTVSNAGTLASGAIQSELQQDQPWFAIAGGTCGDSVTALAAGGSESCTVGVQRLSGDNDAVQTAQLRVAFANGGASAATVSGAASGFASALSLTPSALTSNVTNGTSPGPVAEATVTNTGSKASGALTFSVTGSFAWSGGTCSSGSTVLNPGASCTVRVVRYAFQNDSGQTGALSVHFPNGGDGTVTLNGSASGFASAMTVTPASGSSNVTAASSPGPDATFTLRNTGNTPSGAISVALADTADFTLTGHGTCDLANGIAANRSCTVTAARTASDNDSTGKSTTLNFGFANGGTGSASLSGTAAGWVSAMAVSSDSIAASISNGSSPGPTTTVTVTNTGGTASGSGSATFVSGSAYFQIASNGCSGSVQKGATCSVGVRRIASGNDGTQSGTLRIAFANGGQQDVTVSGSASGFAVSVAFSMSSDDTSTVSIDGGQVFAVGTSFQSYSNFNVTLAPGAHTMTVVTDNAGGNYAGVLMKKNGSCMFPSANSQPITLGSRAPGTEDSGGWIADSCWVYYTNSNGWGAGQTGTLTYSFSVQ